MTSLWSSLGSCFCWNFLRLSPTLDQHIFQTDYQFCQKRPSTANQKTSNSITLALHHFKTEQSTVGHDTSLSVIDPFCEICLANASLTRYVLILCPGLRHLLHFLLDFSGSWAYLDHFLIRFIFGRPTIFWDTPGGNVVPSW
jgi:hypothetical protein